MNAVVGVPAAGQGGLAISAEIADTRVCAVRISSTRATNLSRLFVGRPADEAPLLAERIFSICGASHRVVAACAIARARGEPVHAGRNRREAMALIAESLGASLRSNAILALQAGSGATDLDIIRPIGELLSHLRDLCSEALAPFEEKAANRKSAMLLIEEICALGRTLGLWAPRDKAAPDGRRAFEELEREFMGGESFAVTAPDSLVDADDAEVMQRLRAEGASFGAAPWLEGRAPETGAFARRWAQTDFSKGALAARFHARMIDVAEAFRELGRADSDAAAPCGHSPAPREGFAAVETSRGRLYHWVRLTGDDRIEDHRIVAPTEWNFHPTGPFIEALLGATISRGCGERRIVQLAGLFDPCVPFRVAVREDGHA